MEVDTESTNTSVEDKTEDFCDNPTRDALTEGLMRLLKPTIDQLEEKVRTIRLSTNNCYSYRICLITSPMWFNMT